MRLFYYILAAAFGIPLPHDVRKGYLFRPTWNGGGGLDWPSIAYARKRSRRAKAFK